MSGDLPVRGARVRRRGGQRRASAGFSPRRAVAALVLLAAAGATWGVVASPVFGIRTIQVEGAGLTGDEQVRAALGLASPAPNVFTVPTDVLRERLLALPAVADAEVSVGLPGTIHVRVTEREPVLAWRRGESVYLVDREGRVVADASSGAAAAAALADGLPRVIDRRQAGAAPAVGGDGRRPRPRRGDAPALARSRRRRVERAGPPGRGGRPRRLDAASPTVEDPWVGVFGFYGPEIRKSDMIPEQVRLLRSLLLGREATILRAILAGETEGTFITKPKE